MADDKNLLDSNDVSDYLSEQDPQQAVASAGFKTLGRAALNAVDEPSAQSRQFMDPRQQEPGLVSPLVDPIDMAGGALGAKLGSAMARDAGAIVGNEIGAIGKNVKKGAPSLPMDEASRLARAKKMGFDTDKTYYHGTKADIDEFKLNKAVNGQAYGKGVYVTERPQEASDYAMGFSKSSTENRTGANVLPVYTKLEKPFNLDSPIDEALKEFALKNKYISKAQAERVDDNFSIYSHLINKISPQKFTETLKQFGYDGVEAPHANLKVIFEPNQIRSKFAEFDPKKAKSGKIAAGVALGAGAAQQGEQRYAAGGEVSLDSPDVASYLESSAMPQAPSLERSPASEMNVGLDGHDVASYLEPELKEQKYGTLGQQFKTGLEGFAQGVAGPLAPMAEEALGVNPEDMRGRAETNPITHYGSEIGGLIAPALVSGGTSLAAKAAQFTQAGALEAVAKAIIPAAGETLASKIGVAAAKGALDNALISGSDEVSKMILQDPDQSAETAVVTMGAAALLGGGIGGVLGSLSPLWKATVGDKAGKMVSDFQGEVKFQTEHPEHVTALADELTQLHKSVSEPASEVYGANGLKGAAIEKAVPEMHEGIKTQATEIVGKLQSQIATMKKDPGRYPSRLVSRLEEDLAKFQETANPKMVRGDIETIQTAVPKVATPEVRMTPVEFRQNPLAESMPWLRAEDAPARLIRGEEQTIQHEMQNAAPRPEITSRAISFEESSPKDIFNAVQDLKQTLQGYSKFDKFVKPTDEAYDFVRLSKSLSHDLRTSLEDVKVWGSAAKLQAGTNAAFKAYLPSLQKFESTFMTKVPNPETGAIEMVINPGKVNTFINQLGKPNAEIKQTFLENFIKTSERYKSEIGKLYDKLGIESPIQETSKAVIGHALEAPTLGSKLAKSFIGDALGKGGSYAAGAGIGAATAAKLGLSKEVGALIGGEALQPFFKSILPALAKSFVSTTSDGGAMKAAVDYAAAVAKGEMMISKAAKNVFRVESEVIPASFMPKENDHVKMAKALDKMQTNPEGYLSQESKLSHYLPNHQASMGITVGNVSSQLNSSRASTAKKAPLDSEPVPSPVQKAEQKRVMDIAQQPLLVLDKIKKGTVTAKDLATLGAMYPKLLNKFRVKLTDEMTNHLAKGEAIPYKTRIGLSMLLAQPLDSTMAPASIQSAQSIYAPTSQGGAQQQSAQPKGVKSSPALQKMPGMYATPGQASAARRAKSE